MPARVREAILARRASLPAEARHVVDLVSVVPARAEIELVRATVTSSNDTLAPAVEAGLLTFDGRTLGFRHELARLAVLESLPLLRVQELHRTVLAALSASADRAGVLARLAHHAVGAGDSDAVQRYAQAAARQAACLGAHREAAAHYRTALAWADALETAARAEILDLLSYECYLTGELAAAWDARVEALGMWRQLNVPRAIGAGIRWLSRLAWFLGDYAESRQRAMEALDVLTPLGEDEELAMALSNRAQLHMLAREHEPCAIFGQRAIDMARRLGSVEVLSHALNNVGSSQIYLDYRPRTADAGREPGARSRPRPAPTRRPRLHESRDVQRAVRATTRTPSDGSRPASITRTSAISIRGGTTCSRGARGSSPRPATGQRLKPTRRWCSRTFARLP